MDNIERRTALAKSLGDHARQEAAKKYDGCLQESSAATRLEMIVGRALHFMDVQGYDDMTQQFLDELPADWTQPLRKALPAGGTA